MPPGIYYDTGTGTSATTYPYQNIWGYWNANQNGTLTPTSSGYNVQQNGVVWVNWNEGYQNQYVFGSAPNPEPLTAEAIEAQRLAIIQAARGEQLRINEMKKAMEAAARRAEQLLFMFLTPDQKAMYLKHGYFDTDVNDTTYRIHKGRARNIRKMKDGKAIDQLCVHPIPYLPDADNVLAQLLALRTDQAQTEHLANHSQPI